MNQVSGRFAGRDAGRNSRPAVEQLMAAVLVGAFRSIEEVLEADDGLSKQEMDWRNAERAGQWIVSDRCGWPLDYLEICAALSLDPAKGRLHAEKLRREITRRLESLADDEE